MKQERKRGLSFRQCLTAGLSTDPADRARATAAFAHVYRHIGLTPVPVIWVGSPWSASVLLHTLSRAVQLRETQKFVEQLNQARLQQGLSPLPLPPSSYAQVGWGLGAEEAPEVYWIEDTAIAEGSRLVPCEWGDEGPHQPEDLGMDVSAKDLQSIMESSALKEKLKTGADAGLWAQWGFWQRADGLLGDSGDHAACAALGYLADSLWGLGSLITAALYRSWQNSAGYIPVDACRTHWQGQWDVGHVAHWRSHADAGGHETSLDAGDLLRPFDEIGQSCGWWYPRDGLIIACDRPAVMQVEEDPAHPEYFRAHASGAPAIQFRDGWTIYARHGVYEAYAHES